jgi:WD40 repeat protein
VPLWHQGAVTAAVFSPDGQVVLTGCDDGTARFWDTATGRPLTAPLRHGPIKRVAYAPDGRTAMTITERGHLCCWPAPPPPLQGTLQRLALWAESLSGHDMDADGVMGWQSAERWNMRRRQLQAAGGSPLPGPDVLAWHRHEVSLCLSCGDWYAAHWHLDRLTAAEPKRAAHWSARGKARALQGQYAAAVADYTRAIELGEKGRTVRLARGTAYTALRQWEPAVADFEAAGVGDGPELACLYLLSDRVPAYKALCQRLLVQVEQKKGPTPAYPNPTAILAWVCALSSQCPLDVDQVAARVERELKDPQNPPTHLLARLHYRGGRLDQAIKECQLNGWGSSTDGGDCFYLLAAMAYLRLGQPEQALFWVDGVARYSFGASSLVHLDLETWLEFHVLSREATPLLRNLKWIRPLLGHTGAEWQVVFSADGSQLLSASQDQTLRLWDTTTGKEQHCFRGHTNGINGAALSRDGRRVLSGGDDGTVRLWDTANGKELHRLDQAGKVTGVVFTPDGRRAVICSYEGIVQLWEVDGWKELRRFSVHEGLWSMTVCPRGRHALVAGGYFTPDGKHQSILQLWDLESGKEVRRFDEPRNTGIWRAVFSADGRQALSASTDGVVRLWDVGTGKEQRSFQGHAGEVLSVAFAPDGRLGVSGGTDGTVRLWDLSSGKELARQVAPEGGEIRSVAFSPEGDYVLFGCASGPIRPWRLPKAQPQGAPSPKKK